MKISVILPVLNEEENLVAMNDEITGVLNDMQNDYEIIYVDDGSTDGTHDVLQQLCEDSSGLMISVKELEC